MAEDAKPAKKIKAPAAEPEPEATIEGLKIVAIDGIDAQITAKLKKVKITTINDLMKSDATVLNEKTKIPLNKIIELQKKAQLVSELVFDEEIILALGDKNYTIEQAIEETPKKLMKVTSKENKYVSEFLEKLRQVTIFLDVKTCRETPVTILNTISAKAKEDERKANLLWLIELILIIALAATLTMTITAALTI